jgi:hypothetical protein
MGSKIEFCGQKSNKNPDNPVNPVRNIYRKLMTDIVGKLWNFCHTLRHDGIDYGDYIEQLTYLLFLKIIEEKGGCKAR